MTLTTPSTAYGGYRRCPICRTRTVLGDPYCDDPECLWHEREHEHWECEECGHSWIEEEE